jgi:hypothetical protein
MTRNPVPTPVVALAGQHKIIAGTDPDAAGPIFKNAVWLLQQVAHRAHVIDMSDAYGGVEKKSLWITAWDSHPNAQGHQMLAESFYNGLKTQLGVGSPASGAASPAGGADTH